MRTTTIGFEAVKALLAGRVDGATAFWNVEGVALKAERPDTREFRVDDFGAPAYPELVLCVTRRTLDEKRPVIAATIRALQRGYTQAQTDPESARHRAGRRRPGARPRRPPRRSSTPSPRRSRPAPRAYGELREDVLREWAAWDVEFGILDE